MPKIEKAAADSTQEPKLHATEPTAQELLELIRNLALELRPHLQRTLRVELDSDIDRDLGLDSLGRAELFLRLDRAFKVRLPEELIGVARTPRDILEAVLAAAPDASTRREMKVLEPVLLPEITAPASASTLIDVLDAHVTTHGDRPHIWLWRSDTEEERITYAELDNAARQVAHGLRDRGLELGERVAIMLPTEPAFFHAFFGILMAGGIPVPIYPPFRRTQVEDHLRRQASILGNSGAAFLVVDEQTKKVAPLLHGLVETLRCTETVSALRAKKILSDKIALNGQMTALIQYTSGSTGDPKGVVLTHANLLANIRAMGEAMEADSKDVFVSWLPLYHDMGLIGAWLGSLYYGVPVTILPPLAFLADPSRWFWAIHRHRATLSAAPNFAYELCLKNVRDADIEKVDLSSLRMVANGAEPISPNTLERFTERFAACGFKPEAMAPVYGLAESSVGLAFPPVGRAPIIDRVDRVSLSRTGVARPAEPDDANALEFVACGQPLPGHEIRIVDEAEREVEQRREGRLQFRGPSVTSGYYRNPEKTQELFSGDWAESGDRAYIAGGDIYLTGRIKDIIIRAGRNIYPHELEELVGGIDGVRNGCVAAFPSTDARTGTERLILVAETRWTEPAQLDELRQTIAQKSSTLLGLPPDDIMLVGPNSVPKTSSGKVRRSDARALYEKGTMGQGSHALWWQLTRLGLAGSLLHLRRAGRKITQLAYALYWWSVLIAIALLAWPLVVLAPRRSWAHAVAHGCARAFFRLTGIALDIDAEAPISPDRTMIVCNHSSYLDGAAICAVVPGKLSFVAKAELAGQLVAGPFLRRLGTIFVRRFEASESLEDTDSAVRAARAGERLVTFPEGTISRMPGVLGFHLGAFEVAARTNLPVVPVTINGTRSILRDGQWFPRRGAIRVHIGEPISPDGTDFASAVRLRDAARGAILAQSNEPDLVRERVRPVNTQ